MPDNPKRHFTHIWREPWVYRHPTPPRSFRREMADLLKYSTRMDGLKAFLTEKNLRKLIKLRGSMLSFGDHDMFGNMILDFDCPEEQLRRAIVSMSPKALTEPLKFVREDIYDSRAWCHLLLSDFVNFTGKVATDKQNYNRLQPPEFMPEIHFGLRNFIWEVDRKCFKAERRQKKYKQVCVMTFTHPQLKKHFQEGDGVPRRWVGEMEIPEGKKLKDIEPLLFEEVEKECAKHYVRVSPTWQERRLCCGEFLEFGKDYQAKIHIPNR